MLEIKSDLQEKIEKMIVSYFHKENMELSKITFHETKITMIVSPNIPLSSIYSEEMIKLNYFTKGEKKGLLHVNLHHPKLIISKKCQDLIFELEILRQEIMNSNKLFFISFELYFDVTNSVF